LFFVACARVCREIPANEIPGNISFFLVFLFCCSFFFSPRGSESFSPGNCRFFFFFVEEESEERPGFCGGAESV
jgi:hypothetical protein